MRVGIPRGLLYYQYYPMWKAFFDGMEAEVVISQPTTRHMLAFGCSKVVGDVCLPVKVFCGHVSSLANDCDCVFIPSIHSVKHKVYNCPKFIGLPDLVRATVPQCPPVLDPDVDVTKRETDLADSMYHLGCMFSDDVTKVKDAVDKASQAHQLYRERMQKQGFAQPALAVTDGQDQHVATVADQEDVVTIALIGHPYLVYDQYINHDIVRLLVNMGARVVYPEAVGDQDLQKAMVQIAGQQYWGHEEDTIGAGGYYLGSDGVDGVISLVSFGCGPDSLTTELLKRHAGQIGKPFVSLVIDEHTAQEGLNTRLEAFVDMVRRGRGHRRPPVPVHLHRRGADNEGIRALGIPNFANLKPAFRASVEMLGVSLLAPPVTKATISLGTKNSPEFVCLPFKGILGTFIESLEMGADTLLMVTSSNACRMGYYSKVQEQILRDLGYEFKFLRYQSSEKGLLNVLKFIRRYTNNAPWTTVVRAYWLGVSKLKALDDLQREMYRVRAVEVETGKSDRIFEDAVRAIDEATSVSALKQAVRSSFELLDRVPKDERARPLRVGIVGELYVVMEPFFNMNVEGELGKRGVEVRRNRSTFYSEYTRLASYMKVLNNEKKDLQEFARPYLSRDVGGHGLESIGEKVHLAREGFNGIVHLAPFTCMPEAIAQNVMLTTKEQIPVLTIICDEQMGHAGLVTRVEAFVDLLHWRRKKEASLR